MFLNPLQVKQALADIARDAQHIGTTCVNDENAKLAMLIRDLCVTLGANIG